LPRQGTSFLFIKIGDDHMGPFLKHQPGDAGTEALGRPRNEYHFVFGLPAETPSQGDFLAIVFDFPVLNEGDLRRGHGMGSPEMATQEGNPREVEHQGFQVVEGHGVLSGHQNSQRSDENHLGKYALSIPEGFGFPSNLRDDLFGACVVFNKEVFWQAVNHLVGGEGGADGDESLCISDEGSHGVVVESAGHTGGIPGEDHSDCRQNLRQQGGDFPGASVRFRREASGDGSHDLFVELVYLADGVGGHENTVVLDEDDVGVNLIFFPVMQNLVADKGEERESGVTIRDVKGFGAKQPSDLVFRVVAAKQSVDQGGVCVDDKGISEEVVEGGLHRWAQP